MIQTHDTDLFIYRGADLLTAAEQVLVQVQDVGQSSLVVGDTKAM